MGDDKKGKKSGGFRSTALKLVILIVLIGAMGEIAARYTGNYDLSPTIQIQRLLKR